jgi:hypothetical protein
MLLKSIDADIYKLIKVTLNTINPNPSKNYLEKKIIP